MFHVPEKHREQSGFNASDDSYGNNGCFLIPLDSYEFVVIASDGDGWEHVSASLKNRCPNWKEMCLIKDMFWDDGDCVMQLHPPKKDYVNCHPYCLHLWRPTKQNIPQPDKLLVGI